jgi:hypothetical protein
MAALSKKTLAVLAAPVLCMMIESDREPSLESSRR